MIRLFSLLMLAVLMTSLTRASAPHEPSIMPTGQMQTARACHTAAALPDGRVLVAGGIDSSERALNTAELYDPLAGTFTYTGDMLEGRSCAQTVSLPNGQVLILGGWGLRTPTATIERYDPLTGTFTGAGSMTVPRSGFSATVLKNGLVLIVGGSNRRETHTSAELYDPASGTTLLTGSLPLPRTAHSATLLADGRVLIAGGSAAEEAGSTIYDTALIYDPQQGVFMPTGTLLTPRHKHAARLLPDGDVLIMGGANQLDWRGRYTSSERYDSEIGLFSSGAYMTAERFKFDQSTLTLENGTILVSGGSPTVERYLPDDDLFVPVTGALDADRFYQTATLLPGGAVLITGGYDYDIQATSGAWLYHP